MAMKMNFFFSVLFAITQLNHGQGASISSASTVEKSNDIIENLLQDMRRDMTTMQHTIISLQHDVKKGNEERDKLKTEITSLRNVINSEIKRTHNASKESDNGVSLSKESNKDIQTVIHEMKEDINNIHKKVEEESKESKKITESLKEVTAKMKKDENEITQNKNEIKESAEKFVNIKRRVEALDATIQPDNLRVVQCPQDVGYCVKKDGADQNDGQIVLENTNTIAECLKKCHSYSGSTGCEVMAYANGYVCSVHTKEVVSRSGVKPYICWAFNKCPVVVNICEHGSPATIACQAGHSINILSAIFGSTENGICHTFLQSTTCGAYSSFTKVHSVCQNQQNCSLVASNTVFGDPCPGVVKYLQVEYQCVEKEEKISLGGKDTMAVSKDEETLGNPHTTAKSEENGDIIKELRKDVDNLQQKEQQDAKQIQVIEKNQTSIKTQISRLKINEKIVNTNVQRIKILDFGFWILEKRLDRVIGVSQNCIWYSGRYGESLTCPGGYVATGLCASGRNDDCGEGVWNKLRCCKLVLK